jgi:N-hydroxyarylamine O-acetyltransferase
LRIPSSPLHSTLGAAPTKVETRVLDADGIEDALRSVFGLPVEPEWRPLVEKAARPD